MFSDIGGIGGADDVIALHGITRRLRITRRRRITTGHEELATRSTVNAHAMSARSPDLTKTTKIRKKIALSSSDIAAGSSHEAMRHSLQYRCLMRA